jgi:ribonuclease Z
MALKSGAKKLLLGHFSSKYEDLSPLLAEAGAVFENVELAIEGVTYRIF